MADGVVMSPAFAAQVVDAVRRNVRSGRSKTVDTDYDKQPRVLPSRFRKLCVVLDAALPAATDSMRGASSCLATVCTWSIDDEEYVESDLQVTVWNHSETIDHAIDTFGKAEPIDGHLWFFGDCDAMANREGV